MRCQIRALSSGAVFAGCPSYSVSSRCGVKSSALQHYPQWSGSLSRRSKLWLTWRPSNLRSGRSQWSRRCQAADAFPVASPQVVAESRTPDVVTGSSAQEAEDDDYPLWMEEDDPTWPEDDPDGEGYGFRISPFFEPKITADPADKREESPEDDELDMNWEAEQYQWVLKEITSLDWSSVAIDDPTPLIFFAFERYGPNGSDCWKVLEAVEKVVRIILESRKYPLRAVKLDISMEPDVGTALKIKEVPTLLFINGGKPKFQISGVRTADEILAITSHIFYHSARPACMDEYETSQKAKTATKSG